MPQPIKVTLPATLGPRYAHLADLRRWAHYDVPITVDGERTYAMIFGGVPRRSNGRLFVRLWFGKQRYSGWAGGRTATLVPTKATR